jgi:hypothetical protein
MKWVSMIKQQHTNLRSPCAMPSVNLSDVKLAAIGLWNSGNALSGVMNHASPSGSLVGGGIMVWGCFMVQARPLSSSEGKS